MSFSQLLHSCSFPLDMTTAIKNIYIFILYPFLLNFYSISMSNQFSQFLSILFILSLQYVLQILKEGATLLVRLLFSIESSQIKHNRSHCPCWINLIVQLFISLSLQRTFSIICIVKMLLLYWLRLFLIGPALLYCF